DLPILSGPASRPHVILIVEPDDDMRRYLSGCLRHEYRIVEARTGTEAIAIASRLRPDLIVTAADMPDVDGFVLCHTLYQMLKPGVPMLLTGIEPGKGGDQSADASMAGVPMRGTIIRSFNARSLRAHVAACLPAD